MWMKNRIILFYGIEILRSSYTAVTTAITIIEVTPNLSYDKLTHVAHIILNCKEAYTLFQIFIFTARNMPTGESRLHC